MAKAVWLTEKAAAEMINRHPRTLRKKAKSGAWNVSYRTIQGRGFQYSEKDLENLYTVHRSA